MRTARVLPAALAAALFPGCGSCRGTPAPPPLVYVSDEDTGAVFAVDPVTAAVVARIHVGKRPRAVKLSRDGKLLYVALSG